MSFSQVVKTLKNLADTRESDWNDILKCLRTLQVLSDLLPSHIANGTGKPVDQDLFVRVLWFKRVFYWSCMESMKYSHFRRLMMFGQNWFKKQSWQLLYWPQKWEMHSFQSQERFFQTVLRDAPKQQFILFVCLSQFRSIQETFRLSVLRWLSWICQRYFNIFLNIWSMPSLYYQLNYEL